MEKFEEARSGHIFSAGDQDNERREYCMGSASTVWGREYGAWVLYTTPTNNRNFLTVSSFDSKGLKNYFYVKMSIFFTFLDLSGSVFLCETHGLIHFFSEATGTCYFLRVSRGIRN